MAKDIIVKGDNFCTCTYNGTSGYTIRVSGYSGATFTVGIDGSVSVGQSQRFKYALDDWNKINEEIRLGIEYMARVSVLGFDPYKAHSDIKKISARDYKVGGYYRDKSNRGILYMGKTKMLDGVRNRLNCPYCMLFLDNYTDLLEVKRLNDGSNERVFGMRFKMNSCPDFDTRVNKPANLIEELQVIPDFSGKVTIYDIDTQRRWFVGIVGM